MDIFCWFDDARSRFFATFRTNISMLEIKPEIKNRIMTHDRAIVAVRYISRQKQVIRKDQRIVYFNELKGYGGLSSR